MPDPSELDRLIAEYTALDEAAEPQRAQDLLARAAALVDRQAAPNKWAALRNRFADLAQAADPAAAIAAYRDALTVWDPVAQRDSWTYCHMQLGSLLATAPPGTPDAEAALVSLDAAVDDHPYMARLLATLYGFRPLGDPADNWRRRITCYELALAHADPAADLARWAAVKNELAVAYQDEPGGNYAAALERRLAAHADVLDRLRAAGGSVVDTCLQLATAYLDRPTGDPAANGRAADRHIDEALAACGGDTDDAVRIQLLLLRSRCLTFKQDAPQRDALHAALTVLAQARALAEHRPQPELRGSVEKFAALAWLALLRLGDHQHREAFVASCEAALALFGGPTFGSERRKILQIQADGLLEVGDLPAAAACCEAAVALADQALAEATSIAGRLERIWEQHDSAGLLAGCRARAGDLAGALAALDHGKARLWRRGDGTAATAVTPDLIPVGGALVFPIAAGRDGVVILATRRDGEAVLTRLDLPAFGRARVRELQRGADASALGGWLLAYQFRRSQPERFRDEIVAIGEVLYREFWAPVLAALEPLGVGDGAELVVFPDGGSASFPLQAASWMDGGQRRWLTEHHAVRYAPSLRALARAAGPPAPLTTLTVVAANPEGDLRFGALEVAWIQDAHPAAQVLEGEAATRADVLAALQSSSHVHIATHAAFDLDDPLASRLRLADADVTVLQLVEHLAARRPGFVALSACETAVTRVTSLADELLGFPTALLEAGVDTVLATQWSVDDEASAILVGLFYEAQAGAATTADALRCAQDRLRTLTVADLSRRLRAMRDRPGPAGALAGALRTRLLARDDDERPFAHPYFWAGFCVVGGR